MALLIPTSEPERRTPVRPVEAGTVMRAGGQAGARVSHPRVVSASERAGATPALRLRSRFRLAFLLASALLLAGWPLARAAENAPEYAVKAGYLFNFTKYTEWPAGVFPNAAAPLVIGVLGEDPFGPVLEKTVAGRTSQDRPVQIRRARDVKELRDCQVVFISRSERTRLPGILTVLRETRALTVCDTDAMFDQGVMIKLTMVEGSVRFEVRLEPAEAAAIKFNSRMLDAAKRVWPNSGSQAQRP